MRKILASFLISSFAFATAPTGYKNETATVKTYAQDLVFPNNQLTKQPGLDSRIETGNTNLLINPSFEHSTVTTGWTIANATASADTTNQVEGKKALSLSLTGALDVYQDSTINAANLVGLQGNASIKIKTSDVDGLKVCARNAGVTSTSLCVNIPKDGVWKEINIPYILTATSNGIAITSTGTSGTVKLDDSFVGTSAPFQNVNGAKLVGGVIITGCAGRFQTTSTTFASFGTQTGCVYTTFGQAIQPSVTNLPVIKFASLPAGDYVVEYSGAIFNATTGNNTWVKFHDGTNYMREEPWMSLSTSGGGAFGVSGSFSYSTAQSNITFEARSKIQNGTGNLVGSTIEPGVIKVFYYPPESKIYSQASQDYDWTSYTPTFTGFGTVANATFWHKREGSDLLIRGNFKTGTVTATTPSLTLPNSLSIDATKVPSAVSLCSISQRGISATTGSQFTNYTAINPSTPTVLKFATGNNGLTGTNEIANAVTSFGNGEWQSISTCRIPITGWQDYGVIVGSFVDVPTVPGQNNVEEFTFSYGATATTNCTTGTCAYLDKIGNGVSSVAFSSTGNYLVTFAKPYLSVKCEGSVRCIGTSGAVLDTPINCTNCSSATLTTIRSDTSVACNSYGTITCRAIK